MLYAANYVEKWDTKLPLERCTEAAAFTYCGVDLFGLLLIKEKRSELKRYGAPFTCVSSRAVHIEVTKSLYTESFILAPCRFMARRGAVCSIWSDNGTNFVVARNKLQRAFKEMKHDEIKSFLQRKWCRLDFMAQQSTWCISYLKGLGMPNSICKNYFGKIVEDWQSPFEC